MPGLPKGRARQRNIGHKEEYLADGCKNASADGVEYQLVHKHSSRWKAAAIVVQIIDHADRDNHVVERREPLDQATDNREFPGTDNIENCEDFDCRDQSQCETDHSQKEDETRDEFANRNFPDSVAIEALRHKSDESHKKLLRRKTPRNNQVDGWIFFEVEHVESIKGVCDEYGRESIEKEKQSNHEFQGCPVGRIVSIVQIDLQDGNAIDGSSETETNEARGEYLLNTSDERSNF